MHVQQNRWAHFEAIGCFHALLQRAQNTSSLKILGLAQRQMYSKSAQTSASITQNLELIILKTRSIGRLHFECRVLRRAISSLSVIDRNI